MSSKACRAPVRILHVLGDVGTIRRVIAEGSPYWTVQRYLRNVSEMASLSDAGKRGKPDAPMLIAPWFRGDLALEVPLVPSAAELLALPAFADAARALFGLPHIVPQQLYLNLNPPMPQVDPGHVDVPTFRGVDRRDTPIWLLAIMQKSGLFERWYVPTATAVAWFYSGVGGGFRYWPEGPDAAPSDLAITTNSALVGDNDRMFHAVLGIGEAPKLLRGLTLDSALHLDGDAYRIVEDGRELARFAFEDVRVSLSWKAFCFASAREHAAFVAREDALTHADVMRIFSNELARRGRDASIPDRPLEDRGLVDRLNAAFGYGPTVFAPRAGA